MAEKHLIQRTMHTTVAYYTGKDFGHIIYCCEKAGIHEEKVMKLAGK